jgi:hypothetical protein
MADFSDQFGGKIQPRKKKFGVFCLYCRKKFSWSVSVGTLKYFLDLPRIREKKRRKTNFPEV